MSAATVSDQPRAIGTARLSSKLRGGRSCLDHLHQSGALKLLFPRGDDALQAVLVNTAGGVTGGDRFGVDASAGTGSRLQLTTQAAERAYRAQKGQTGRIHTRLNVANAATLHWLPQETILYNGAAISRRLDVQLAENGQLLMVEPLLFGRHAMGEEVVAASFTDCISIRQGDDLIFRDGVRLHGDIASQLDRPAIASGARAMALLVYVAPDAAGHIRALRDIFGRMGGFSLLGDGILVGRLLAHDGFDLRRSLVPALNHLTGNTLPKSWRL
ncbi:urease accessory protein UreD [Roseobacter sp. YSTF-M11]|uniref:Urease accessory protein UreD n=1 Tax=Roseobacter insulae TaxID=2859783 RepID=A0A9X1K2W8_9RHOB|nr:urease accessory protein UreD [Roseobacter insulae]MBW4708973.1 urease accessory protein UreD [Roseobacter insulae]